MKSAALSVAANAYSLQTSLFTGANTANSLGDTSIGFKIIRSCFNDELIINYLLNSRLLLLSNNNDFKCYAR